MPGFNGEGPYGMGAMTGGGRGKCYSYNLNGINNSMNNFKRLNREFGRGFRCKRFGGIRFYNDEEMTVNDISFLKYEAARLKNEIDEMEKRIISLKQDNKI